MTAAAIRAAAADFHGCLERLWPVAARRGISRNVYAAYTATLTPDLRIMDLLDSQPEFTKSFWDYLDLLVSDDRIAHGRALLEKYRATFDAVERAYGVDRYLIAAIWGVETNYGTLGGERPVIRSTATLACIGRRQHYFREEFFSALEILQRGDVKPDRLVGSWAGAFGPTQFMPTAFKRYAVDFDHDGRRDVVDSIPDIIASTANNLKKDGWVSGQTWGYEVVVPANFNFCSPIARASMTIREWERHGLTRPGGKPFPRPDDRAFLLVPAGVQGPGFLMLPNFRAIMSYNPAEAYALAIGHLADRLRGGGPSRSTGRATSGCCRATSGWSCSNCWPATATMSASRTATSAPGPGPRSAISRPGSAGFPMALPRRASSTSCGRASADPLPGNRGHLRVDIFYALLVHDEGQGLLCRPFPEIKALGDRHGWQIPLFRWLFGAAILAAVECAGVAAVQSPLTTSAQAQLPMTAIRF